MSSGSGDSSSGSYSSDASGASGIWSLVGADDSDSLDLCGGEEYCGKD